MGDRNWVDEGGLDNGFGQPEGWSSTTGPFYVNSKLWWHIKGRGFVPHDLLIPGA